MLGKRSQKLVKLHQNHNKICIRNLTGNLTEFQQTMIQLKAYQMVFYLVWFSTK